MKIEPWVVDALDRCVIDGPLLCLPDKLERAANVTVDKALKAAGGKWDRSKRAHVFDGDAADAIEPMILTGEVTSKKQEFGQFDTPADIAEVAVQACGDLKGKKLLEPSAGHGALALPASLAGAIVFGYEIDPKRYAKLLSGPPFYPDGGCAMGDFLSVPPHPVFDVVLMNPPFAKQADVAHVVHALGFLKPGGRLVAIMSAGFLYRQNTVSRLFRTTLGDLGVHLDRTPGRARAGGVVQFSPGAFKASGTMVNAVMVVASVP